MNEIIINGKALYTPKGAAREYAAVACNFFRGCPYQCQYCYNRNGRWRNTLGVNHAILEKKFKDENDAVRKFMDDVQEHADYLKETGIFFSFTTDPMTEDTYNLTRTCALWALRTRRIPITILTKNAQWPIEDWQDYAKDFHLYHLMKFGFTLTGRDDMEEFASKNGSSNHDRIKRMQCLKELGFSPWASIEPIVDLESSLRMIKESIEVCDHYKIGLMSHCGNSKNLYDPLDMADFINSVNDLVEKHGVTIYWKKSIRDYIKNNGIAYTFKLNVIN